MRVLFYAKFFHPKTVQCLPIPPKNRPMPSFQKYHPMPSTHLHSNTPPPPNLPNSATHSNPTNRTHFSHRNLPPIYHPGRTFHSGGVFHPPFTGGGWWAGFRGGRWIPPRYLPAGLVFEWKNLGWISPPRPTPDGHSETGIFHRYTGSSVESPGDDVITGDIHIIRAEGYSIIILYQPRSAGHQSHRSAKFRGEIQLGISPRNVIWIS